MDDLFMNDFASDYAPFDGKGGVGKMYKLFGDEMDPIIDEMNEAFAAQVWI